MSEVNQPPIIRPRLRISARLGWLTLGLSVVGLVLFWFNPAQHAFYPQCALYKITGLLCPGCGGLRAVHQLAHGHLLTAFRFNPLAVLALPPFCLWAAGQLWRELRGQPLRPINLPSFWIKVLLIALIAFGVLRNLPMAPFTYLAPPKTAAQTSE